MGMPAFLSQIREPRGYPRVGANAGLTFSGDWSGERGPLVHASLWIRSFGCRDAEQKCVMIRSIHSPKDMIAIGTKHVLDQRLRIERHKEFICKLERDGQPNVIAEARRLLCEMKQTIARMQADIRRAAQERVGSSTKRDTPA
jgi:hypothetical protein